MVLTILNDIKSEMKDSQLQKVGRYKFRRFQKFKYLHISLHP